MILALFAASARHLARDRASLLLSFLLPLAFFSVTALAFTGGGRSAAPRIPVYAADVDRSAASRALLEALAQDPTLALWVDPRPCPDPRCASERAAEAIASAQAWVGIVIQAGFGSGSPVERSRPLELIVLEDGPGAARIAERALESALGPRMNPPFAVRSLRAQQATAAQRAARGALSGLLVVFLLFSAAGASGWLIEEEQQGTLSLLLTTRAGLGRILGAQWLFLLALGSLQSLAMIAWAAAAFGLELGGAARLGRVAAVVTATAAATAAFGLLLAAAARTRSQLGAASTLAILLLGAIGGSFVPQQALPETIRTLGLASPTTWAVAGLWQALADGGSLGSLLPPVTALGGFAALFFAAAYFAAHRRVVL